MKILLVGVGGVGEAIAAIAKPPTTPLARSAQGQIFLSFSIVRVVTIALLRDGRAAICADASVIAPATPPSSAIDAARSWSSGAPISRSDEPCERDAERGVTIPGELLRLERMIAS